MCPSGSRSAVLKCRLMAAGSAKAKQSTIKQKRQPISPTLCWLWWIGLATTAAAFIYEHAIVRPDDLSRVNRAFFTANGFVGIALFVFALLDLTILGGLRP